MFDIVSQHKTPQVRRRGNPKGLTPEGLGNWVTGFMGREGRGTNGYLEPGVVRPGPDKIFPMAFLVEQDPHSSLSSHFHIVDQFQVFTAGRGRLAADDVEATSVQFVSPYTPYGPIQAGPEGIHYFTLRNGYDPGARYMPESIRELPPRPRKFRQAVGGPAKPVSDEERMAMKSVSLSHLIVPEADGMGTWLYRIPPGQIVRGPDPRSGRGQHWVVLAGSLDQGNGSLLEPFSCAFLTEEEPAFKAKAGAKGLEILALQYPRRVD